MEALDFFVFFFLFPVVSLSLFTGSLPVFRVPSVGQTLPVCIEVNRIHLATTAPTFRYSPRDPRRTYIHIIALTNRMRYAADFPPGREPSGRFPFVGSNALMVDATGTIWSSCY